jgi:LPS-assembly protein
MKKSRLAAMSATLLLAFNLDAQNDNLELITLDSSYSATSCFIYNPNIGIIAKDKNISVEADTLKFSDNQAITLNNNVKIDFPGGRLNSSNALIGASKELIEFKKDTTLSLEQLLLKGDEGFFNRSNDQVQMEDGTIFLSSRGLNIDFKSLQGSLDDELTIQEAEITSCADPKTGWLISADDLVLNNKTYRGYAKNLTLQLGGASVFKAPYLPFATTSERLSGFLEPSISSSSDGIDFSIPYFAILSDHSDITLGARNIAERGSGVEINYRYIKEHTKNNVDAFYFNNDKEIQKNFPELADSRWAFKIQDSLMLNKTSGINFGEILIDWAKASDAMVLRDIPGEITAIGLQRDHYLSQNIIISSRFNNLAIELEHQGFQSLNPLLTNGYKKSPAIDLSFVKTLNSINVKHRLNIATFKASSLHEFFGASSGMGKYLNSVEDPIEGRRTFSDLTLSKTFDKEFIKIKTSLGLKSLSYDLQNESVQNNNINSPNLKIDISSMFVKMNSDGMSIIQPRLVLGYSEYKDQSGNPVFDTNILAYNNQVFFNDRFSGMDRIADDHSHSIGFTYKLRKSSRDIFKFGLAKKYNHSENKVYVTSMPPMMNNKNKFIMSSMWMPDMNHSLKVYGGYDTKDNKLLIGGINFMKKSSIGTLGIAKRYRRMAGDFKQTLNYSEIFTAINLKNGFKIIGKLQQDDEYDIKVESMLGIEYENCCVAFRVMASDKNLTKYNDLYNSSYTYLNDAWDNMINIENKSRINFEFELKGFNSSINKIDKLLQNSILNY